MDGMEIEAARQKLALRRCRLAALWNVSRVADAAPFVLGPAMLVLPAWLEPLVCAMLALPFLSLYLTWRRRKGTVIYSEPEDAAAWPGTPFLFPGVFMSMQVAYRWTVTDYGRFWPLFWALLVALPALNLVLLPATRRPVKKILLMLLACLAYAYGGVISFDIAADGAEPALYSTTVLGKRKDVTRGREQFFLYLTDVPGLDYSPELVVSKERYLAAREGDPIDYALHKGRLGIPWVSLARRGR